jgi:hypothetical protein
VGLREVDGEVERDVEVQARRAPWRRDRSARLPLERERSLTVPLVPEKKKRRSEKMNGEKVKGENRAGGGYRDRELDPIAEHILTASAHNSEERDRQAPPRETASGSRYAPTDGLRDPPCDGL